MSAPDVLRQAATLIRLAISASWCQGCGRYHWFGGCDAFGDDQ